MKKHISFILVVSLFVCFCVPTYAERDGGFLPPGVPIETPNGFNADTPPQPRGDRIPQSYTIRPYTMDAGMRVAKQQCGSLMPISLRTLCFHRVTRTHPYGVMVHAKQQCHAARWLRCTRPILHARSRKIYYLGSKSVCIPFGPTMCRV